MAGEVIMSVFKAYDVRGIYPRQIDENFFKKLGYFTTKKFNSRLAVVGRDMRESGVKLKSALVEGIREAGSDVIDIGMCSSPLLYYSTGLKEADLGFMITASHNPSEYNGCKVCKKNAAPVSYESGLSDVEKMMIEDISPNEQFGKLMLDDTVDSYYNHLLQLVDWSELKPCTIVVDAGNGVVGEFIPLLFKKLNIEGVPLYFEPDGSFPNHEANPLKKCNMIDLQKKVLETEADFGIAFDGDGDRVGFVDELGAIVPADVVAALLAKFLLQLYPREAMLYDTRSSKVLCEEIIANGGIAYLTRVGHSFIKEKMRDTNAIFASEFSGHFYFRDFYYSDNTEFAMVLLMLMISKTDKSLSKLVKPLRRYYASGEKNFIVPNPESAINDLKAYFLPVARNISHFDGLSVDCGSWWGNMRISNTEPIFRANIEAETKGVGEEIMKQISRVLQTEPLKE